MKAKSIKGKSPEEIKSALHNAMADGFKPTLAFAFISIEQDRKTIISLLDREGIAVFGATTVGEFTDEGINSGSIVLLLLDMNPDFFEIVIKDHTDGSAIQSGRFVGKTGLTSFKNPSFIISGSNINSPGELIMEGILEVVDDSVTVIGGMAGDAGSFSGNSVFTNHEESLQGVLALIIDSDKVILSGEAVSGWKAVGTEKTITSCDGPWIHTIDNKPAMDVVKKFTGIEINDLQTDQGLLHVGTTFPLQVTQKNSEPVMRPLLLYNTENQAVMCGGKVAKGSRFRFSLPPDFDVVNEVVESSKVIKSEIMPEADALLIFSCIGRQVTLGPLVSEEIQGIQETWGTPMAGFFCMGEFGKTRNGRTQFHGTTCSWVVLREK